MSTDPVAESDSNPSDKTREILITRLRKAYIKPGEPRDRYSEINRRWNSDVEKDSVTADELRELLNEVSPSSDPPDAS